MSDTSPEFFDRNGLGKKMGKLPLWGWALLVAVGVYIFYRFYVNGSSSAASIATPQASTGTNPGSTTGTPYNATSTGNGNGNPTFYDNQSWQNAAETEAASFGSNALDVQAATSAYLNGQPLTQNQGSIINQIISSLGAAPLGTSGQSTVQTPYQTQAANLLDEAFGGNFTNADAQLGTGNANSSRQTAINTKAGLLASGQTPAQVLQGIESGPSHQAYVKNGGA